MSSGGKKYIIGIDEVGRGALAGPVTVCAFALPGNYRFGANPLLKKSFPRSSALLKDSKKLSAKQREGWFAYIKKNPDIVFGTTSIQPKTIDRINISRAANRAATKALVSVIRSLNHRFVGKIYLDGGLCLEESKIRVRQRAGQRLSVSTLIQGDEKINAIKFASIVAKVKRDALMARLHRRHPRYHFDIHKGYGTAMHRRALVKYGLCKLHRRSFCKKFI